jgi:leucyl-tRNA synthetase
LAEEIFRLLHGDGLLCAEAGWPAADPLLLVRDSVTMAVQVMGKLRATVLMSPGADAETAFAAAEADPAIIRLLEGKRVVKRIHVPDRIVNLVVAPA